MPAEPGRVDGLSKHEGKRLMVSRDYHQDTGDDEHPQHMPPGRQIVHEPYRRYPERVNNAACHQDNAIEQEDGAIIGGYHAGEQQVPEGYQENSGSPAHRRRGNGESDKVQPAGEPAPGRRSYFRGPVVQAARRRHRRGKFGHGQCHEQAHDADQRPAPRHDDRAAIGEADVIRRQGAGEHGDDGERDGEVAEAAEPSPQLLRVAQPVKDLLVGEIYRTLSLAHLVLHIGLVIASHGRPGTPGFDPRPRLEWVPRPDGRSLLPSFGCRRVLDPSARGGTGWKQAGCRRASIRPSRPSSCTRADVRASPGTSCLTARSSARSRWDLTPNAGCDMRSRRWSGSVVPEGWRS